MEAVKSLEHNALKNFGALNSLSDQNLERVGEAIRTMKLPAGGELHANLEQGWLLFLVTGRLTLINQQGERFDLIEEGNDRAYDSVFPDGCSDFIAVAPRGAELMRIDRLHVEVMLSRQLSESTEVKEVIFEGADTEVFASILEAQEAGTLKVPSLPEVATAVNEAAHDEEMDFQRFAAIVQRDPPCTARLIQIANSPSYRGAVDVETLSEAISRLGMDGSRHLIMAIAVEQLVGDVHPVAMRSVRNFYSEAGEIGALCFVMAKMTGCLREERAYMAGLLHGLGMVPIVNHACEVFAPDPDIEVVEGVAQHLAESVSAWLLSEWGLDSALCDAAEYATDWYRPVGEEFGVVEFVIAARMLRMVATGGGAPADIPKTEIGKRLIELGVDLQEPEIFLNKIQEDLDTARQLLG